ncbi:hypothetical protein AVEN_219273-1 [Araneus ventricosus]|uniref:Uncharacterized protein n=1 Tax=Araneus ventricosus TaxID=182803 RepID=A0A4Y2ST75_ARAVE|nr:hypothetical protein AVEN_219273-1 [Araneus ventricosus]
MHRMPFNLTKLMGSQGQKNHIKHRSQLPYGWSDHGKKRLPILTSNASVFCELDGSKGRMHKPGASRTGQRGYHTSPICHFFELNAMRVAKLRYRLPSLSN